MLRIVPVSLIRLVLLVLTLGLIAPLTPASSAQVTLAHLASRDLGWAVVDSHAFVTTDEGSTWADVTPTHSKTETLSDVTFVDRNTGFVTLTSVAVAGTAESDPKYDLVVARTADGGQTWQKTTIPNSSAPMAYGGALTFIDAANGWLVAPISESHADLGYLFRTGDGGKTWRPLPIPPASGLPHLVSKTTGWLAGGVSGGDFWRTDDGGLTWQEVTVPYVEQNCGSGCRPIYLALHFSDPLNGWLTVDFVTDGHELLHDFNTKDGGKTWNASQLSTQPEELKDVGETVETASGPIRVGIGPDGLPGLSSHGTRQIAKSSGGSLSAGPDAGALPAGFLSEAEGWVVRSVRACPAGYKGIPNHCPRTSELLLTRDGGRSYERVTPVVQGATSYDLEKAIGAASSSSATIQ